MLVRPRLCTQLVASLATLVTSNSQPDLRATLRPSIPTQAHISPISRSQLKQLKQEWRKIHDEITWCKMQERARTGESSKDSPEVLDLRQRLGEIKLKIEGGQRARQTQPSGNGLLFGAGADPGSDSLAKGAPAPGTPGLLGGYQRKKPMGSDKVRLTPLRVRGVYEQEHTLSELTCLKFRASSFFPTTLHPQPRPRTKPRPPSPSDFVVPTLHAKLPSTTPEPAGRSDNPRPRWAPTWDPALSPPPSSTPSNFLEPHRTANSPPSESPTGTSDSSFSSRLLRQPSMTLPSLSLPSAHTGSNREKQHKAALANRDRATVEELRRDAQLRKVASMNNVRTRYRGLDYDIDDDEEAPEAEDELEGRVYRQRTGEMLQQEDARLHGASLFSVPSRSYPGLTHLNSVRFEPDQAASRSRGRDGLATPHTSDNKLDSPPLHPRPLFFLP